MSVSRTVYLYRARFPQLADLDNALRANGLCLQATDHIDLRSHSGFLPCLFKDAATGFEFLPEAAREKEIDDDMRDEISDAIGGRDVAIGFVARDALSVSAALVAACVVCELVDGVLFDDESAGLFAASEVRALLDGEGEGG